MPPPGWRGTLNGPRSNGRSPAQRPDLLLRRHHAARRGRGEARLPWRGASRLRISSAAWSSRRSARRLRRRAAHRRLHAGGAAVLGSRGGRRHPLRQHPRDRGLVEGCEGGRTEDRGADRGRRRARRRHPVRELRERGRDPDLRPRRSRDRDRAPAQGSSRRHRADQAAGRHRAAAHLRIPGGEGHDPFRQGLSRRVRADCRRLCAAGAVVARRAQLRAGEERRDLALRHHPRHLGRRAAVLRRRSARRLSARRSRRPRRGDEGGAEGARPHRHLRQAALHRFQRRHLRAFALEDRRLQPLPRSLPGRRDRARRRPRRDRRAYLRRLRAMRGGVPDRRRILRAAVGRRADAQAAHAAHRLSRGRRRAAGHPVPRRCARHADDRRAGALRRRAAGERAAGRGQRGDAGRAGNAGRGVRLWRRGGAAAVARASRATT